MAKRTEIVLSDKDSQRLMAHRLGDPLSIYRLKAGYTRLLHWGGLFLFIISIVFLISVIIRGLVDRQQSLLLYQQHPHDLVGIVHLQEE